MVTWGYDLMDGCQSLKCMSFFPADRTDDKAEQPSKRREPHANGSTASQKQEVRQEQDLEFNHEAREPDLEDHDTLEPDLEMDTVPASSDTKPKESELT